MILPEYLGAVEDVTFTKGYAAGEWGSLNQILSMEDPDDVAVHEGYVGCTELPFSSPDAASRSVPNISP